MSKLKQYIATVQDFPKKGIAFRDITPVLADSSALKMSIEEMQACLNGVEYDAIAGLESRGFLSECPWHMNPERHFCRSVSRESCRVKRKNRNTIWSTAVQ